MARTLIGNIKGKDGRGITSINKTGTTGPVDTYTITYTDNTTSTFTVNNSDNIALQRQIVPSAAVESSATASQAYAAGDYVVVNGILRKVKSAIAKGNAISDSNSTATTVSGELGSLRDSVSPTVLYKNTNGTTANFTLSSAVENFAYVDIYYKAGTVRMYPASHSTVDLHSIHSNDDWSQDVESATLSLSGKSATFTNGHHKLLYRSTGQAAWDEYHEVHPNLAVVLVTGYK